MAIKYATGRTYDTAQVLEITEESRQDDGDGLATVVATFVDGSRGLSGRVEVLLFSGDNLGKEVLRVYDSGNYQQL